MLIVIGFTFPGTIKCASCLTYDEADSTLRLQQTTSGTGHRCKAKSYGTEIQDS